MRQAEGNEQGKFGLIRAGLSLREIVRKPMEERALSVVVLGEKGGDSDLDWPVLGQNFHASFESLAACYSWFLTWINFLPS